MIRFVPALGLFVAVVCLTAAAGCSGGTASASGRVLYDGKVVKSGSVVFYGPDGVGVPGVIGPDGRYEVTGVLPGTVKVTVTSPSLAETEAGIHRAGRGPAGPLPKDAKLHSKDPNWFPIPAQFGKPETSGITIELKAGSNSVDVSFK